MRVTLLLVSAYARLGSTCSARARSNRAVSDVAPEHDAPQHAAHKALIAATTAWFPESKLTRVRRIGEIPAGSVRWVLEDAGWKQSNLRVTPPPARC